MVYYEDLFEHFDGSGFSIVGEGEVDVLDVEVVKELSELYKILYFASKGSLVNKVPLEAIELEAIELVLGFSLSLEGSYTLDEILSLLEDLFSISRNDLFEFVSSPVLYDLDDLKEGGVRIGRFFKEYSSEHFASNLKRKVFLDLSNSFSFVFPVKDTLTGERGFNVLYPKEVWDKYVKNTYVENMFFGPAHFEDVVIIEVMEYLVNTIRLHGSGGNVVNPFYRKGFRPGIWFIDSQFYREISLKFAYVVSFHKHFYLPSVIREIKRRGGGKK